MDEANQEHVQHAHIIICIYIYITITIIIIILIIIIINIIIIYIYFTRQLLLPSNGSHLDPKCQTVTYKINHA